VLACLELHLKFNTAEFASQLRIILLWLTSKAEDIKCFKKTRPFLIFAFSKSGPEHNKDQTYQLLERIICICGNEHITSGLLKVYDNWWKFSIEVI
jgi:hypothetical protein